MELKGKRILVTGAGGFIGSHLTEALIKKGAEVRAFLRYNSKNDIGFIKELNQDIRGSIEIFYGDLRELESVELALKKIDVVFNLAALVGIPYSYQHPQAVLAINTLGALNVLTAARQEDVEKIIQTSTSEIYGSAQYVPIDEKHPLQPQSPYAASKVGAEAVALSFQRSFNMPIAVIRPFNTYGPRQSMRAVIPTIITQAITQNVVKLGNLKPTRDFNYISDTVNGFLNVATSEKTIGKAVNVGSGRETSISELANTIIQIVNPNLKIIIDKKRLRPDKSEVLRLCADIHYIKKLTGWTPKVNLNKGLSRTIEYYVKNRDQFEPGKYVI